MEKFQLNNGMSVVFAGHSKDYSVCLSVNIGHVNEPSKGIAALFEKTLLLQVKGVIPVFGGTMTAYTTGGEDLEEALEKVAQIFNSTETWIGSAAGDPAQRRTGGTGESRDCQTDA